MTNFEMMKSKTSDLRLLYAASEQSADLFYLGGVFVPDSFIALIHKGKSLAVVSQLEFTRVKAASKFDEVLLLESVRQDAAKHLRLESSEVGVAELMYFLIKRSKARSVEVPETFPALYFFKLQQLGVKLVIGANPFFAARECKDDHEAKAIREGNAASAAGIRSAEQVLRDSIIDGKRLKYKGRSLTSERLRCIIDQACLGKGAVAQNTIVAGGKQGCDPHECGYGPLKPNELIIVDVFPRVQKTGYHGDMTRTFLKGRATDAQRALVATVRSAQQAALAKIKSGISAAKVHRAASDVFTEQGFVTERRGDTFVGFIHSTGHGLGLEVHEPPRISVGAPRLKTGQVVTVEPGLYYPEIGGCRIEDVVRVTKEGSELLSSCHYRWEIR